MIDPLKSILGDLLAVERKGLHLVSQLIGLDIMNVHTIGIGHLYTAASQPGGVTQL
jgi:hypothetical protein